MDLRHYRYFIAVAEELNFTRASMRLNIAQPPLSQQIRILEKQLGVVLFRRTKRLVELTDAGKVFLREARLVLAQAQHSVEAVRRAARGEIGELSIGFVPTADLKILPRILPLFKSEFPNVALSVHCLTSNIQLERLRMSQIDVGIIVEPIELDLDAEGFKSERILRDPFVAVLPKSSPFAALERISLRELANEPFVLYRREIAPAYHDQIIMGMFRQARFSPKLSQASDHVQTIVGLVASGLGVSLLPQSVTSIGRSDVVYRKLKPPLGFSTSALIYKVDNHNASLQQFLKIARQCNLD